MLRSFMWDDARNLPWTYDDTDRDMNRLNLIFEERYETYLDEKTREICAQVADDPYMLGYQLDNDWLPRVGLPVRQSGCAAA